jgi:hypothetical protein
VNTANSGIVVSGGDSKFHIRNRLDLEFKWEALKNLEHVPTSQHDLNSPHPHQITVLYITSFFDDSKDFAMYVVGLKKISRFMLGTFLKKAYDGDFFATPCIDLHPDELFYGEVKTTAHDVVPRTETMGIRWKYLYETARAAWEKMSFDEEAFRKLEEEAESFSDADVPDDLSDTTIESPGSEPLSFDDKILFSFSNEDTDFDLKDSEASEESGKAELPQEMELS